MASLPPSQLIMDSKEENETIIDIESACSELKNLLKTSSTMQASLEKMDKKFDAFEETVTTLSKRVAPLQSLVIATKALETRINRAISPALSLIHSFKLSESLQNKLIEISSKLSSEKSPKKRHNRLAKYVDCVEQLSEAINSMSQDGEPAIQKLQEVVEFLSRTKTTDQYRTLRLRETLVTLKALYETEVDAMKFEGLLDEALLNLQDEFEALLQKLKHQNVGDLIKNDDNEGEIKEGASLGSEMEIEILRRIAEILAANDCLDIDIDIFVKVRYRRAAKALMSLNPDYLKTYTPEEIDEMEWENLETAITLWIQHFQIAVRIVFVSEKNLSEQVLSGIMHGLVWSECFIKIADKIMAVFFRFGEGVARSNKEPQKLFKLLDMFDSLENLKTEFSDIFDGEAGVDICTRFRELEKLLIHAASKVFWEFGLQIEGNSDGYPPPQDGSVAKIVRYAINYLKFLTSDNYINLMAQILKTEHVWKVGFLSEPDPDDDNILKDAISNMMEALVRNVESKRSSYKDKVLSNIFSMNSYWYIYMRSKNTELGKLLGDQWMKKKYKVVAEESAYIYQKQAWGPLVKILDKDDKKRQNAEAIGALVKTKLEGFMKGFEEISNKHKNLYNIPDLDLREQIRDATVKFVMSAYIEFVSFYSSALRGKSYLSPEALEGLIDKIFNADGKVGEGKLVVRES